MELTFTREEIPTITRAGGSGREPEPWEKHLAPLKDTPGESFRVWTYEKRTSAVSRMSSVRERLSSAVPTENWKLAVRQLPGTGTPDAPEQFGVYVSYQGQFTDEQVAANAKAHDERSARVKAARAVAEAKRFADAGSTAAPEQSAESQASESDAGSTSTPKERVQQARAKAGVK